jgi:hypothetical protein
MRRLCTILVGNMEGKEYLEVLGIDGNKILKYILKKQA